MDVPSLIKKETKVFARKWVHCHKIGKIQKDRDMELMI